MSLVEPTPKLMLSLDYARINIHDVIGQMLDESVILNDYDKYRSRYHYNAAGTALDYINPSTLANGGGRMTQALATPSAPVLSVEVGRHMAEYVFTGVYRTLLAKDPVKQLEKFPSIREFFFHDTHQLEIEHTGEARCIVRYRYEAGVQPTRAVCESLGGFWSKALDLAGASNTRFTHPNCILKGNPCCEFALSWQTPQTRR